jgi:adenylate kinase family enzyme
MVLGAGDSLPSRPQRILIAGVTGVGKSTLARRMAAKLGVKYTEIDSLYHGPNWTPRETFVKDVDRESSGKEWVMEWQYRDARALLVDRADTLIWLDYRGVVSLARVIRRTIRRSRTHEALWNGNVEPPLRTFFTSEDNIVRWAIKTRSSFKTLVPALEASHPGLQIVRLTSQRDLERWLDSLPTHES